MGRSKRIITKTKELQAEHLKKVREALIDPGTGQKMTQWKFANLINVSEPQLRLYEKCKSDIPLSLMESITKNEKILISGFHIRIEYLLGIDEFMTAYDCIPHSDQEIEDLKKQARKILNNFGNPMIYFTELEKTIFHFFDINGFTSYTSNQIADKKSFTKYMEAEIRNSIKTYIEDQ